MGQYQPRQDGTVKTYRSVGDKVLKISLKSAVGKARPRQLIFAKQEKETDVAMRTPAIVLVAAEGMSAID